MKPQTSKRFPAKIILFGEYSVLMGGDVLSIPAFSKQGYLDFPDANEHQTKDLIGAHHSMGQLITYLEDLPGMGLDLITLRSDWEKGLVFRSEIPINWGTGSSGALIAALFDRYGLTENKNQNVDSIKMDLATMESFFHSRSSGIDPMVSYLQKPIAIRNGAVQFPSINLTALQQQVSIFLLDSGMPGLTKSGVSEFWQKNLTDKKFQSEFNRKYIPYVDEIIDMVITNTLTNLYKKLETLGKLQFRFLGHLFPDSVKALALAGQKSGSFTIKLCGSGGGGYFLLITNKTDTIHSIIDQHRFAPLIPIN